MSRLNGILSKSLVGIAAALLLVVGGFVVSRALSSGEVIARVTVGSTDLAGLSRDEAIAAVVAYEDLLTTTPARFIVDGAEVVLDPVQVRFDLDEEAMVDQAMTFGREGNISEQFRWWLTHFFRTETLPVVGSIDEAALDQVLEVWDADVVGDPPFDGAVEIEGTRAVARYPQPGRMVDRSAAADLILAQLVTEDRVPVELPIVPAAPRLTDADVDAAVAEANLWLSAPVTLVSAEGNPTVEFSVADIARALRSETRDGRIELSLDTEEVARRLEALRDEIESPPVDARLEVLGYDVVVVAGRPGTLIDPEETARNLAIAAGTASRRGVLPFEEGAPPEVTAEELEALGIKHLVSAFTTYHPCCQPRVNNIQLFADIVNGAIVMPGETFELNEYVGERTAERGFVPAGTIIGGELVDTVGGGVSQFATTFYNAVFWGGYEDVVHKPHSFYFTRYPEGIEATISWPEPKLEFRNDTDNAILIVTEYTKTSITVKFYSDNDGRIVVGEQRNGKTIVEVVEEGGPDARRVSATVSGRYAYTDPPETEYRPNPDLDVDEQHVIQRPARGWSVKVTRTIVWRDETTTQEWIVRYRPKREIIEVHPCMVPDSEVECPVDESSTTTTDGATTTSSTP